MWWRDSWLASPAYRPRLDTGSAELQALEVYLGIASYFTLVEINRSYPQLRSQEFRQRSESGACGHGWAYNRRATGLVIVSSDEKLIDTIQNQVIEPSILIACVVVDIIETVGLSYSQDAAPLIRLSEIETVWRLKSRWRSINVIYQLPYGMPNLSMYRLAFSLTG
ncbi:hypothetical protein SRABI89_00647 [Pseudomonas koreensis]|nr:hypothetical protein SRABI89_00647 [Pseudomonas koreensis]